jgi:hypothetical protein
MGHAKPVFSAAIASARQVMALDGLLDDTQARAQAMCILTEIVSGDNGADAEKTVFDTVTVHRHSTADNEYLYYDILVQSDANDAGHPVSAQIYYGIFSPDWRGDSVANLTAVSTAGTRYRARFNLKTWAGVTHPADGDPVRIVVTAKRSTGVEHQCTVTVFELEEQAAPASYTALTSSTALKAGQTTAVPTDLNKVADNALLLYNLCRSDVVGFRALQTAPEQPHIVTSTSSWETFGSGPHRSIWKWYTTKGGTFYYKLALKFRPSQNVPPKLSIRLLVNSTWELLKIGHDQPPTLLDGEMRTYEGQIALTDFAWYNARLVQERMRVDGQVQLYEPNSRVDPAQQADAEAIVYYLGEGL